MTTASIQTLFDLPSHNPSFQAVKTRTSSQQELRDFCVPVNLHFPPPSLVEAIRGNLAEILRHYPDYSDVHADYIGEFTGLDPRTIVPANGSTEVINVLCREAAGPMLTSIPTFGRWTDLPIECGVPLYTIQRRRENNFCLDTDAILARVREVGARTLVLSNPNNPTGAALTFDEIKTLARELKRLHTVIIDESFIDFSDIESAAEFASQSANVVVVKSMGKSLGWHGVRLGYAVAERKRARALQSQLPFWNINGLAAFVLRSIPHYKSEYLASFEKIAQDRAYMMSRLSAIASLTVFPSNANFIFTALPDGVSGRALRDRLLQHYGLIVRETSNKLGSTEQYLRLAVQGKAAVDVLIAALSAELSRVAVGCTAISA